MIEKQKGLLVNIKQVGKDGNMETKPYWVDGNDVYEIEKQEPKTGVWQPPFIVEGNEI